MILLLLCSMVATALILSLRSMKDFLPEIAQNLSGKEIITKTSSAAPHILNNLSEYNVVINNYLLFTKNKPQLDIGIEIIRAGETQEIVFYTSESDTLWSQSQPEGYVISEDNYATINNPLATQFIVRHKYNNIYYVSKRVLYQKNSEYIESNLDAISWKQFITREHIYNPKIMTIEMLMKELYSCSSIPLAESSSVSGVFSPSAPVSSAGAVFSDI